MDMLESSNRFPILILFEATQSLVQFFFEAAEGVCMRRLFSFQCLIAISNSGSWR
jgi:hypothetical protein